MNKENDRKKSNELRVSLKGLGFFVEKDYLVYIFKKTEKLATALYLVTTFFKDEEPLKWTFREKGMYLLSNALIVNDSDAFDRDNSLRAIFSTSLEILSLLEIAAASRLISEMNHSVIKREFEALITRLRESLELETSDKGFVLSDAFFDSSQDTAFITSHQPQSPIGSHQKYMKFPATIPTQASSHKIEKTQEKPHVTAKDKKNDRKEKIISLLSHGETLTIKDFTKVIHHCSEKTIQRELLDLVEKGVLKKEGERRWSRYSLA